MSDTTQSFIDNLITVIWNAEDPESVTNEMVARVFDHLNKGYKDLESRSTDFASTDDINEIAQYIFGV